MHQWHFLLIPPIHVLIALIWSNLMILITKNLYSLEMHGKYELKEIYPVKCLVPRKAALMMHVFTIPNQALNVTVCMLLSCLVNWPESTGNGRCLFNLPLKPIISVPALLLSMNQECWLNWFCMEHILYLASTYLIKHMTGSSLLEKVTYVWWQAIP